MLVPFQSRNEGKCMRGKNVSAEDLTAKKELADCYSRVMGADKWRRYVQLYRPDGTEEKF